MIFKEEQKRYPIEKSEVWEAFKLVRAKGESPGVDGLTIDAVDSKPRKYLYPVWNRLTSGSYLPPAVRQKLIPKANGKMRALGIPTVTDRVAQMVIKQKLEKHVDVHFSANSFGYRPGKSAHDAIEQCRENCQWYNWAIDLDIEGFFDNIDHELTMQMVSNFTQEKYILLYAERWLKAPVQLPDGTIKESAGKGTPQGGVISPLLANIYLHFAFDEWFGKQYPKGAFERYADDIIVHCSQYEEAVRTLESIELRLKEYKLNLNRSKTKIVYCNSNQKQKYPKEKQSRSFDFLGYTFKPRIVSTGKRLKLGFSPAISKKSQKRMCERVYKLKIHRMVHIPIDKIAEILKPIVRGWINYYGKFRKSALRIFFRWLNFRLAVWVRNKYRRFRKKHLFLAYKWLMGICRDFPNLFIHWEYGFRPVPLFHEEPYESRGSSTVL
jgi:group II intron reverse transcriptase/maturase